MKILHIITGLGEGGAEAMLAKLVGSPSACTHVIVSLGRGDALESAIRSVGITVHTLRLSGLMGMIGAFISLRRIVQAEAPDLIQGWLNHGNLFAVLAKLMSRSPAPVIFNVRQSLGNLRFERVVTRLIIKLNALLSSRVAAIIYNSMAAAREHEAIGYDRSKGRYIPNGFDLHRFQPSSARRADTRRNLGIEEGEIVVGLIARFHPWKNHTTFFQAASDVLDMVPNVRFLLAGSGVERDNRALVALIPDPRLLDRCLLLGSRPDIPDLTAALDIACNVSHGEGFPNTIGEAMAAGVPCVVADVSDLSSVVGSTGVVSRSLLAPDVAEAIITLSLLSPSDRRELGRSARHRVEAEFSLPKVVERYDALYAEFATCN